MLNKLIRVECMFLSNTTGLGFGCPCSLLVFFEEHAANSPWGRSRAVGDVVYHTAGLALTDANFQNDVPATMDEYWRLS